MIIQHVGNNRSEINEEQIICECIWTMLFLDDLILVFANMEDMNHSLPTQIKISFLCLQPLAVNTVFSPQDN